MDVYIQHKGVVLDEADLDGPLHDSLESLATKLYNETHEEYEELRDFFGLPELQIHGFASERFGRTILFDAPAAHKEWITPEGTFESALLREFERYDLKDASRLLQRADADPGAVEAELEEEIRRHERQGHYLRADTLREVIVDMHASDLPCVYYRKASEHDGLMEGLFDYRGRNRGTGTRLLAEYTFHRDGPPRGVQRHQELTPWRH